MGNRGGRQLKASDWDQNQVKKIIAELNSTWDNMVALEQGCAPMLAELAPHWQSSAANPV